MGTAHHPTGGVRCKNRSLQPLDLGFNLEAERISLGHYVVVLVELSLHHC